MQPPNYGYLNTSDGTGDASLVHLIADRSIGSTDYTVDTVDKLPAFFIGTYGTLSGNFLEEDTIGNFFGHIDDGAIVIDAFCPGTTDAGNTDGQVIIIKPSTSWSNMVAGAIQAQPQFPSTFANFVENIGAIWTQTSGLVGAMSAGYVWYNGLRYGIPAVTSHTFTASKDTYIDVNPVTGSYTYVAETNGAAEPALTSSSVRVGKIETDGSGITSVFQLSYQAQVQGSNIDFINGWPAWTSWTPTWTGTTIGNATVNAKYQQIGKTVHFRINVSWGSTSVIGSGVDSIFTLPVTTASDYFQYASPLGYGTLNGAGATVNFRLDVSWIDDTHGVFYPNTTAGSPILVRDTPFDSSSVNPGTGDKFCLFGTYEAA